MLVRLWNHLTDRRKKQFILLQVFIVFTSFFEMASLGAVIPFLAVLADPTPVFENDYAKPLIILLGISDPSELAFPITLIFIGLIVASATIRLILLWALTRLSFQAGADLSINIYRNTLYQDYSVHVSRNSSEVINGIITKNSYRNKGSYSPSP